jgi:ubiquinone biosynthesis protein
MLQKTMVVVEGVARQLDPHLNMWVTAEPVVGAWIAENLGPRGKIDDLGRAVGRLARLVADAPERLERVRLLIERSEAAAEASIRADESEIRRGGALVVAALWIIVALLAVIAFKL